MNLSAGCVIWKLKHHPKEGYYLHIIDNKLKKKRISICVCIRLDVKRDDDHLMSLIFPSFPPSYTSQLIPSFTSFSVVKNP